MKEFELSKLTRRSFLIGLAGVVCLKLPQQSRAAGALGSYEPFSFAYISDVHLAMKQADSYEMLQESQLFLQDVVKTLNSEKLDFVIFGGDQVETPGRDDSNWQLFLDVVQSLSAPWTFVLGEKDVSGPRVVDKMKMYGGDWTNKGIKTEKPYWSQTPLQGVHLIGLDTSRANVPTGDISKEQLDRLKADLVKNNKKFTIVFSHHPLLPPPPFDGGPPWDDWILPQGPTVREILGSSRYVRLALSGHVHMSKIQQERDIWYVSNPSLAAFPCAFRIFHVTTDDVTIETYQISYPALVKKAKQIFGTWELAFKYNEQKPEAFAEVAEGGRIDQNCVIGLGPDGTQEVLKVKRKKKEEPQAEPEKKGRGKKEKQEKNDKNEAEEKEKDQSKEKPAEKSDKAHKNKKNEKQSKGKSASEQSAEPASGPDTNGDTKSDNKPTDNLEAKPENRDTGKDSGKDTGAMGDQQQSQSSAGITTQTHSDSSDQSATPAVAPPASRAKKVAVPTIKSDDADTPPPPPDATTK